MATSSDATDTDPYAYTYADRPGEYYAPYTVLFANTADDLVPEHWVARYEREAAKNWDKFYLRHGSTFFRDRHYLGKEWSELDGAGGASSSAADAAPAAAADDADGDGGELERHIAEADGEPVLFEAGCAVGNTLFPLLSKLPKLSAFGVDYSEVAVGLCREDPRYAALHAAGRIAVATGDLTVAMPAELSDRRAHIATLIFVLSAMSRETMGAAVATVASALHDGGLCLLRDYAVGDGAQQRFQKGRTAKKLDADAESYVRQDGTRAYYFTADEARALFAPHFECERCEYTHRRTTNRARASTSPRLPHRHLPQGAAGAPAPPAPPPPPGRRPPPPPPPRQPLPPGFEGRDDLIAPRGYTPLHRMPLDERPPPMAAILADEGLTATTGRRRLPRAGAADDGAHAWADAGEWAEAKLIVRATLGLALGGGDEKAARALALGGADDDAARAAWARMVCELAAGDGDGAADDANGRRRRRRCVPPSASRSAAPTTTRRARGGTACCARSARSRRTWLPRPVS